MARRQERNSVAASARYRIVVQGHLDDALSDWFGGLEIVADPENQATTLTGPLEDQAALRGVLGSLHDMQATILRVERLDAPDGPEQSESPNRDSGER
jgi:hypothetical protein